MENKICSFLTLWGEFSHTVYFYNHSLWFIYLCLGTTWLKDLKIHHTKVRDGMLKDFTYKGHFTNMVLSRIAHNFYSEPSVETANYFIHSLLCWERERTRLIVHRADGNRWMLLVMFLLQSAVVSHNVHVTCTHLLCHMMCTWLAHTHTCVSPLFLCVFLRVYFLYLGGYYHGKLIFPRDYPFKPPRIMMITPNGRFKTNTRLCLSISDFHPDTWNPAWSVATILTGLLSFMVRVYTGRNTYVLTEWIFFNSHVEHCKSETTG